MTSRIPHLLYSGLAAAALGLVLAGAPAAASAADTATAAVNFADASKPGLLKIYVSNGDLKIHAGDSATAVKVVSTAAPAKQTQARNDGLRVLSVSSAGFTLTCDGNVAALDYGRDSWPKDGADFDVTVPKNTCLEIQNGWGGAVNLDGIDGDVSVRALNCDVSAKDLGAGLSIEVMNGKVEASFAHLADNHPVSISSMNGEVLVRVPANAKAQVRFRTHNGTILTDFADTALKTSVEDLGGANWTSYAAKNVAVAAEIARQVGHEIADNAREMADEMRDAMDEARKAQDEARQAREEAKQEQAEAAKEAAAEQPAVAQTGKVAPEAPKTPETPRTPRAPRAPRPPNIPAISGGKVVSGTLNGGGTLLQITTMNGDITLRHL